MIEKRFITLKALGPLLISANTIRLKSHIVLCEQLKIDPRNQNYTEIAGAMHKKIGQISNF